MNDQWCNNVWRTADSNERQKMRHTEAAREACRGRKGSIWRQTREHTKADRKEHAEAHEHAKADKGACRGRLGEIRIDREDKEIRK